MSPLKPRSCKLQLLIVSLKRLMMLGSIALPPLLLIIKDNIKISKNEPLLVLVVTSQIIYEIASKKLVLDLGEPINSSSTPKNIIISNMHINVVKMLIHNSQINVTRVPK
jgi:hypothetical protein